MIIFQLFLFGFIIRWSDVLFILWPAGTAYGLINMKEL